MDKGACPVTNSKRGKIGAELEFLREKNKKPSVVLIRSWSVS